MLPLRALGSTFVLAAAIVAAAPVDARAADPKDVCFDAYVQGQRLRNEGKLREARAELLQCAQDACPPAIKADCMKWTAEIERAQPTMVFTAKDEHGQDIADAQVYVDNQKVVDQLDGRPVAVNPGAHTVRFERAGRRVEQRIVVAEGDRDRRVEGTFAASTPPQPAPVEPAHRTIPTATLILGGLAAVGLVSFATFAIAGRVKQSCAPNCSQSDVSTLRRDYLIADISWIVGLAAAGAAVYFWVFQPPAAASATSASIRVELRSAPGGGALGISGAF